MTCNISQFNIIPLLPKHFNKYLISCPFSECSFGPLNLDRLQCYCSLSMPWRWRRLGTSKDGTSVGFLISPFVKILSCFLLQKTLFQWSTYEIPLRSYVIFHIQTSCLLIQTLKPLEPGSQYFSSPLLLLPLLYGFKLHTEDQSRNVLLSILDLVSKNHCLHITSVSIPNVISQHLYD